MAVGNIKLNFDHSGLISGLDIIIDGLSNVVKAYAELKKNLLVELCPVKIGDVVSGFTVEGIDHYTENKGKVKWIAWGRKNKSGKDVERYTSEQWEDDNNNSDND